MKSPVIKLGALIAVFVIAGVAVFAYTSVTEDKTSESEVEKGLAVIKELESVEVADVEKILESIAREKAESEQEWNERSLKERYENAMVLGDSEAASLSAYDILSENEVAALVGCSIEAADEHVQAAIDARPSVVFMTYGKNDLGRYGSPEEFVDVYAEKISTLQKGLPDAKIYITSIFPSAQFVKDERPYMANDTAFNEALQKKAEKMNLEYIDCTELVSDEYYEPDRRSLSRCVRNFSITLMLCRFVSLIPIPLARWFQERLMILKLSTSFIQLF